MPADAPVISTTRAMTDPGADASVNGSGRHREVTGRIATGPAG